MATVVQEYVEKYVLDPSGYVSGAQKVRQTTQGLADDAQKKATVGFGSMGDAGKAAFATIATVGGLAVGAVTALGAAGAKAFMEYAGFESLVKALEAIEGSSKAAAAAMSDLKRIAQQPGIGFEESVRGYAGLRRNGLSRSFSERAVSEAGNANALSGGNKETFGRIMLALQQIAIKPYLQGDELRQLSEAGIAASKMVKDRYGTSDGDELKKKGISSGMVLQGLIDDMAKLPRVAGGAQNSLDNLADAFHFAVVDAGSGLLEAAGGLDSVSTALAKFTDAGIWSNAVNNFAAAIGLTGLNAESGEGVLTGLVVEFQMVGYYAGNFTRNLSDIGGALAASGKIMVDLFVALTAAINPIGAYKHFFGGNDNETDPTSPEAMRKSYENEAWQRQELLRHQERNAKMKRDALDPLGDPANDPGDKKAMATVSAANPTPATPNTELGRIVLNTERTARATESMNDFKNLVLGGGVNGQAGLSLNDITGIKGGGSSGSPIKKAVNVLVDAIGSEMSKQMRRNTPRYLNAG